MLFKRHSKHDRVLLEEVCRTTDNTSELVLKILVVCIEAMYRCTLNDGLKRQTRVSMVPEKNVSSRRTRHAFDQVQSYGERKDLG